MVVVRFFYIAFFALEVNQDLLTVLTGGWGSITVTTLRMLVLGAQVSKIRVTKIVHVIIVKDELCKKRICKYSNIIL